MIEITKVAEIDLKRKMKSVGNSLGNSVKGFVLFAQWYGDGWILTIPIHILKTISNFPQKGLRYSKCKGLKETDKN